MAKKHTFKGTFINVLKHNKDGAFGTQANRRKILLQTADTLWTMGYKLDSAKFIRTRHVYKLVEHWKQTAGNESGTLQNKMAALRWLMEKFNKAEIIPSNEKLGIPKRQRVTGEDKSQDLTEVDLDKINKPLRKLCLRAQKLFGLRIEESLKIQPNVADKSDRLYLKASWCKGGRERYIPIETQEQREWLDEAKAIMTYKNQSIIPMDKSYKKYLKSTEKYYERKGICKTHGLRHLYAQTLYKELTGWECPAKGGPSRKQLTPEQKPIDKQARLEISLQLGHCRISVVSVYLSG